MTKTILVVGTFDTRADETAYLIGRRKAQGGTVLAMDVSVPDEAQIPVEVRKHGVAAAVDETIDGLIAQGEDGEAFAGMRAGAALLTRRLHDAGQFNGMIAPGCTLGADLALDCAQALPIGVPKSIVSTVAGSPLIAARR